MGSSCSHPDYTLLVEELKKGLNTHVECMPTNVTGSINSQADNACTMLKNNPHFSQVSEINVVGQSQGGLIARSIVEDCNMKPKVRNLLTIGTPNMGFSELPMAGC